MADFEVAATELLRLYHSSLPKLSLGIYNLVLPVRPVEKSDGGFKERSFSLIKNKNEKEERCLISSPLFLSLGYGA